MKITKDQIRKLQTLKHQVAWLCKDRATWESFLSSAAGREVHSSTELSLDEGIKVINALQELGGAGAPAHAGFNARGSARSTDDKSAQMKLIERLLDGRGWAYADALAKRICKVDSLRFVRGGDLRKIIAALQYDRKRRESHAAALH